MANITIDQFIDTFNAGYETDEDALNAIRGLAYQWRTLVSEAQAKAARAGAQQAVQQAEGIAQTADATAQAERAAFVTFIASLAAGR